MKVSIVILTYNRRQCLSRQMELLSTMSYPHLEIIIVDNCSKDGVDDIVQGDKRAKLIRNSVNEGAVGRNRGMEKAKGEIVITLDDDVFGLNDQHIYKLIDLMKQKDIAAINFKIIEENTGKIIDWCHPRPSEKFNNEQFETSDISEGAVAFRKNALVQVGYYPKYFFISHEGPDLALRLINAHWRVIYSPIISVTHVYDMNGRKSWRRYYYDTRNLLWLVIRNFDFVSGSKRLIIGWTSMLIYSLRDGYFRYWCRAVCDAIRGSGQSFEDRCPLNKLSIRKLREIEKFKYSFWAMVRRRLFRRDVRI